MRDDWQDIPAPTDDDMPPPPSMETEPSFFDDDVSWGPPQKPPLEKVTLTFEDMERCLKEQFKLPSFREGQREVIETVLGGRNALAVMPTGAGKSLCFQLPGLLLPGVTLVISPLIALMKDQVDSLLARDLPATYINSTLSWEEQRERLTAMRREEVKLVFIAPERFRSGAFKRALASTRVSLFVIDEAHCMSEWGHDFRPDYLNLGNVRRDLGEPLTLALTATATPKVRADIIELLGMPEADVFVKGFERPNLFMEVYRARGKKDKLARMEALLHHAGGTSIVYCATRKAVEEIAGELQLMKLRVGFYHGGLSDEQRDRVQDHFMSGQFDVLVATNAFGMGVDKSDIRAVIHYQMPSSLEAYYQEAGRAGRDGEAAHCLLLYNYADRHVPDFFIKSAHPEKAVIQGAWRAIQGGSRRYNPKRIAGSLKGRVSHMAVSSALRLLRRAGHIEYQASYDDPIEVLDTGRLNLDWRSLDRRRNFEEEKLQKVIYYATGKRCRVADMLRYFGSRSSFGDNCGHCDNCVETAPYATAARPPRLVPGHAGGARGAAKKASSSQRADQDVSPIRTHEDTRTVIRKILACIARGQQRLSVTMIGRILTGSKAKVVLQHGHDKNSTYGLLGDLSARQITALLDHMFEARFLTQEGVCVRLSTDAVEVMKGKAELPTALAETLEARFSRPDNAAIRAAMGKLLGATSASPSPNANAADTQAAADRLAGRGVTQTVALTIATLMTGQSLKEVAQARELKAQTVVRHVIRGARAGVLDELDFKPYLDQAMIQELRTLGNEMSWEQGLKEFRETLSERLGGRSLSYDLIKMNIAYLIQQGDLS